jgi:hypothetical protein
MNARDALRVGLNHANVVGTSYLSDLTDADLLVRPVPGCNHIAWQLGHLISAEHEMMEGVSPGAMPPLPPGFAAKYTPETSKLDSPGAFHSKAEYLSAFETQRAGTLKILEKLSDADLDKPSPERFQSYAPKFADLIAMQGSHWLMHAGQWAVIRRKLGKKPQF